MTIIIPEGFTPHDGNGCPVNPETIVQVMYRDLEVSLPATAKSWIADLTNLWNWNNVYHYELEHIIAYRVIQP